MIIKLKDFHNGSDVLINTDDISSVSIKDEYAGTENAVLRMRNRDTIAVVESVHQVYLKADGE